MKRQYLVFATVAIIAQGLLLALNLLLARILLVFFPELSGYSTGLYATAGILAVSFLSFLVITHNHESELGRLGYILSGLWIPTMFYLLLASVIGLVAYELAPLPPRLVGFLAVAAGLGLTLYGVANARIQRVTTITVKLPNLPEAWKGRTAVLASDIHLGHVLRGGFARKVIRKINGLKPDIVFIPGDFFDGVHTDFQKLADEFKKIEAPLGTYFCSGNHEMFAGYGVCEQAIRNAGIKILEDEKVDIDGVQLAGIPYHQERVADLPDQLTRLNLDKSKPVILLKHVPLQLAEVAQAGVSLMLAGHTHHGQIWPGRLITKRYYSGYDYGFKKFKDMALYVSSGVGTWGPPMRVFTKSEIVHISFH